jgi:hypothetical protein
MKTMWKYGFLLLAMVGVAAHCHKSGLIPDSQVLTLAAIDANGNVVVSDSIPADNYTYAEIRAAVDSSVVDTTTTIAFATDNGTFSVGGTSATAKIDIHGNAYAYLKSKSILAAHVQATVGANYTQNITIQFTTSYPDTIFLNLPDSATDDLANRVNFTTTLYKRLGSVSPGLSVNYNASTQSGAAIGMFARIIPSDTTGSVSGEFWLDSASYAGFIYIQAFLVTRASDSIKTTGKMLITH